jgi:hypothetical protein
MCSQYASYICFALSILLYIKPKRKINILTSSSFENPFNALFKDPRP